MSDMLVRCDHRSADGKQCIKVAGHECPHDPPSMPCRPLAERAETVAGQSSGETAGLIRELMERTERLEYLVAHCWVHSGYADCGYAQMERSLRALYCEVIGRTEPPNYEPPAATTRRDD